MAEQGQGGKVIPHAIELDDRRPSTDSKLPQNNSERHSSPSKKIISGASDLDQFSVLSEDETAAWRPRRRTSMAVIQRSLSFITQKGPSANQTKKRRIWINMRPQYLPGDTPNFYQNSKKNVFLSNEIHTRKYTIFNFIPKNLFEQFRGLANFFFLSLVILQLFPIFQFVTPILTSLPLLVIVIFTAMKDAVEDLKRHKADQGVNRSPVYQMTQWKNTNFRRLSDGFSLPQLAVRLSKMENNVMNFIVTVFEFPFTLFSKKLPVDNFERVPEFVTPESYLKEFDPNQEKPIRSNTKSDSMGSLNVATQDSTTQRGWHRRKWKHVRVGDFVFLQNNDQVPADIAIISTSEEENVCYLETKNLDGETNLKIRKGIARLSNVRTPTDCRYIKGYLDSELPNPNLFTFSGALVLNPVTFRNLQSKNTPEEHNRREPLTDIHANFEAIRRGISSIDSPQSFYSEYYDSPSSITSGQSPDSSHEEIVPISLNGILLRGCNIRNTKWVIGLVVFTGNESKIVLNSGATPSKRSRIEKSLNLQLFINCVILIGLSLICTIGAAIYAWTFLKIPSTAIQFTALQSPVVAGAYAFGLSLILFQTIIPIALFISLEVCKIFQSLLIHMDDDMFDVESNKHASPQAWNLCDELGQIEYIFSDKTGTLTANTMEFRKASINGVLYGGMFKTEGSMHPDAHNQAAKDRTAFARLKVETELLMRHAFQEMFDTKYLSPTLTFLDPDFAAHLKVGDAQSFRIREFFTLLAVCHTVLVDRVDDKTLLYKAQSPDEAALVGAAKDCGFAFLGRQTDTLTVNVMGVERNYQVLNVIEFNSDRKRMSVIVRRPENDILLMCKGADTVIFERLSTVKDLTQLKQLTLTHLDAFANDGLRTLCLAYRFIPEDVYAAWNARFTAAQALIINREAECDKVAEGIEQELVLLGATAIEDKLQEGVPECIATLAKAGIKLWVLTGDKVETAINIGFSCNLLTRSMLLILVQASSLEDTERQLVAALNRFWNEDGSAKEGTSHALVIDGNTLKYGLESSVKPLLLELGCRCKAVLCCRVSPLQKAMVVELVRKGLGAMCLAIGDGANDVSMIQAADVGVGISGKEGLQAAMSADYAIAQFRFLSKLLLVHGRWAYLRTANMTLNYLYKNVVFIGVFFWYQFYSCFSSSQSVDITYSIFFSTLFTLLPTIYIGTLDQDVNDRISLEVPKLYLKGIMQTIFGLHPYWLQMANAFYQSVVIYYAAIFTFGEGVISPTGRDHGIVSLNTMTGFGIIFAVNVACTGSTSSLNWIGIFAFFATLVIWLVYVVIYVANPRDGSTPANPFGLLQNLLNVSILYFYLFLALAISVLPMMVIKYVQQTWSPTDTDIIQEFQKYLWRDGYSVQLSKPDPASVSFAGKTSMSIFNASTASVTQAGVTEKESMSDSHILEVSASSKADSDETSSAIELRQPAPSTVVEPAEAGVADGFGAKDDGQVGVKPVIVGTKDRKGSRVRELSNKDKSSEHRVSVSDIIKGSLHKATEFVRRLKRPSESRTHRAPYRPSLINMSDGSATSNSGFAFSQSEGVSSIITPTKKVPGVVHVSSALSSSTLSPTPQRAPWLFRRKSSRSNMDQSGSPLTPSSPLKVSFVASTKEEGKSATSLVGLTMLGVPEGDEEEGEDEETVPLTSGGQSISDATSSPAPVGSAPVIAVPAAGPTPFGPPPPPKDLQNSQ